MIARLLPVAAVYLWTHAAPAAEPARPLPRALPPSAPALSAVEAAFSARADAPLRQFGYDQFVGAADGTASTTLGAVQGDYRLGTGDTLAVMLRGQKTASKRIVIDAEGRLLLDDLRPVTAAGRTLAELREEVQAAMSAAHLDVEVFVSLAEVRRIGIFVLGPVRRPGRIELTAFATVLDALTAAGGVTPDGSLRRIRLVHPGGAPERTPERTIDLYDLWMPGGGAADERLRDGDRIVVPPLGPTVAVAGAVMRPGIYELSAARPRLSLAEMRDLAGGLVRPGPARALRLAIGGNGEERSEEVADADAPQFGAGDLLLLTPRQENRRNTVRLEGHVHRPGPRELSKARTLGGLLRPEDLRPEPYLPFAALSVTEPRNRARVLRPIDLAAVLDGQDDSRLAEGDALIVLGAEDVDFLTSEAVLALLRGSRVPPAGACRGLEVLARTLAAEPDGTLARGPPARAAATMTGSTAPCPPVFDEHPDLLAFALTHATLVRTGVPRPGFHPTARPAVAMGGASSTRRGEIVDSTEPRYELLGHVRHPGVRPLAGASTLRQALAGGEALLPGIYPLMAVIERFERRTLTRQLIPFSPQEVAAGRADRALMDHDRIHLLAAERVRALAAPLTGDPRAPAAPVAAPPPGAPVAETPSRSIPIPLRTGEPVDPAVAALFLERVVQVRGAVLQPGAYPVAGAATLDALIAAADGPTAGADLTGVEVTPGGGSAPRRTVDLAQPGAGRLTVNAGDAIRVNAAPVALEHRAVTIAGAVRRPGAYDVKRDETLASLIDRAGGLTDEAYPAGTIFTRASERRREKEEYEQDARSIERALVRAKAKGDTVNAEDAAHTRQLVADLRSVEPLGRIVVESNPALLKQRPELDVLLEADDRILIPKRPLSVAVAGEVLRPAALQFRSGKAPEDYIREAGGTTREADGDRAYLVLPDGRAQPLALSSWNHSVTAVPPGSVVVVPRDPKPFEWLELTKNIGGILSSLAITAASISVIAR
ncbi:SLBB domain-containing protein [Azospirillum sp. sgz301742]